MARGHSDIRNHHVSIMTRDNELDAPSLVVGGIVIGLVGPLLALYLKKNLG